VPRRWFAYSDSKSNSWESPTNATFRPPFDDCRKSLVLIPAEASSSEIDRLVRERLRTTRALCTLDFATLEGLQPDLIVTQALCDVCAVAEEEVRAVACALPGSPRAINLEPQTLSQVFAAIRKVAEAAGVERKAEEVVGGLTARVDVVAARTAGLQYRPRVALLEWLDPPFSCGHWNPELVRLAGGGARGSMLLN
jgi:iron complex transport system substrate-binding protein